MKGIEELLYCRWILRAEDKDRYYRIKDNVEEVRKYATEKMGCQLIVNTHLIKLEKIPAQAESSMGIQDFNHKMQYVFLCVLLMFLEDKDPEEQFILSQLTEYVAANITQEKVDWTIYSYRRHLIKVIRFCVENGMLKISDGDEDAFAGDSMGEVLYENTGISKYFMRNFPKDIMEYQKTLDFEASDWVEINEDRGIARRNRVYKRLLFSTGIYKEQEEDEDFEYLKRYGGRLQEDLLKNLNCVLQIHKNSAYLIMEPDCKIGSAFPENNTLSDIVLLCNGFITGRVRTGRLHIEKNEMILLSRQQWNEIILECKEKYGSGLLKTYREKTGTEFVMEVSAYMEQLNFIKVNRLTDEVTIRPIVVKIIGEYPRDYAVEEITNE